MKRFFSLLVALVLLVSMFALPTFAFAEEAATPDDGKTEASHEVGFNAEAFAKYVVGENLNLFVEMDSSFKLNQEWLKNENGEVEEIFPGINYQLLKPEDEDLSEKEERTIKYNLGAEGDNHAAENASAPASGTFKQSQHVTLASQVKAAEGWEFVGWLVPVTFYGETSERALLYRAGDLFTMPDADVEVFAYWYPVETKDEDTPAETAEDKLSFEYPVNDIVCLEYCTPSDDPRDEHWTRVKAESAISVQTSNWWMFRYVVVDGEINDVSDDDSVLINFNELLKEGKLAREDYSIKRFAVDTSNPKVALSSSMQSKMKDGLTVGTTYSISTSLDVTDSSGTTTTYVVYKNVNGEWVQIYDNVSKEVVEGYEGCISKSGVINPLASDVTAEGEYRYKIVYTVKDNNGFYADPKIEDESGTTDDTGFHPTLLLGVKLSDERVQEQARMETWKIVLFVVAGISALGIVALLLIKPKQAVADDARVGNAVANTDADGSDKAADEQTNENE